jgi:hypothetical protein
VESRVAKLATLLQPTASPPTPRCRFVGWTRATVRSVVRTSADLRPKGFRLTLCWTPSGSSRRAGERPPAAMRKTQGASSLRGAHVCNSVHPENRRSSPRTRENYSTQWRLTRRHTTCGISDSIHHPTRQRARLIRIENHWLHALSLDILVVRVPWQWIANSCSRTPGVGGVGVPEKPRDNPMHRLQNWRLTR